MARKETADIKHRRDGDMLSPPKRRELLALYACPRKNSTSQPRVSHSCLVLSLGSLQHTQSLIFDVYSLVYASVQDIAAATNKCPLR
jgi:hypothetical protein